MSVEIVYANLDPILPSTLLEKYGDRIANAAQRGMDKYVPMDTGQLRKSAYSKDMEVVYSADYAMYPYEGRGTIHRDKNPFATSKWDKAYQATGSKEVCEEIVRCINA